MDTPIRILLVGNHDALMASIAEQLRTDEQFTVVAFAPTCREAHGLLREEPADIAVIDLDMAEQCSFEDAKKMRTTWPDLHIAFLAARDDDDVVAEAVRVRAKGFLLKDALPRSLIPALQEIASGGVAYPQRFQSRIVIDSDGIRMERRIE
jgi:DNA-binding NarL/FixJ family response regulator